MEATETYEVDGLKVEVFHDPDCLSPREHDNLAGKPEAAPMLGAKSSIQAETESFSNCHSCFGFFNTSRTPKLLCAIAVRIVVSICASRAAKKRLSVEFPPASCVSKSVASGTKVGH